MEIEKIKIKDNCYVWVDRDEVKAGDLVINSHKEIHILTKNDKSKQYRLTCSKIIAASPELNLEGVPTYVGWLAEQEFPLIDESWCTTGDVHEENLQLLGHRRTYIKGYQTAEQEIKNDKWLSPIDTERKWQEEKLVEIFYHYPNASPAWQYMNGLIHIALENKNKFTEEDLKKAIELARLREHIMGLFIYEPEQIIEQIKSEREI